MNKTVEVFLKHLVNELNDRSPEGNNNISNTNVINLTALNDDAIKKNINAGRKYLDRKEYKQAIFQFEDALYYVSTTKEEKRDIHNMYGKALLGLEQYEDAIKKFQKALDYSYTSDKQKEAYNMLAFSQRKLAGSLLDTSKENYIESLKLDSNYAPALEYYGELLLQMNQLTKSEDDKIDIFDIYDTLNKNSIQPELGELTKALCGWKKNASEGLNFFFEKQLNSVCTLFNTANSNTDNDW